MGVYLVLCAGFLMLELFVKFRVGTRCCADGKPWNAPAEHLVDRWLVGSTAFRHGEGMQRMKTIRRTRGYLYAD